MARKKLTALERGIDEWIAAWIVTHQAHDVPEHVLDLLTRIARDANIRGYIKGSNDAFKIRR